MKSFLYILLWNLIILLPVQAQDVWIRKSDFPISINRAVAFSINGFGFAGTGSSSDGIVHDFWKFYPTMNKWEKIESVPGEGILGGFSFAINGKGYVGGVFHDNVGDKDFWEYDPESNHWEQKASIPVLSMSSGVSTAFVIGQKGYLNVSFTRDGFLEYSPETNTWTKKADFPGVGRLGQIGFSIGNLGYICSGYGITDFTQELWEYNPNNNQWLRKADFPGTPRSDAVGFSIGNNGYLGLGSIRGGAIINDFWEYRQSSDLWIQIENCGYAAFHAFAFSMNQKGYVGTGVSASGKEFWEYTPSTSVVDIGSSINQIIVYPNPAYEYMVISSNNKSISIVVSIYSLSGVEVYSDSVYSDEKVDFTNLNKGIYFIKLNQVGEDIVRKIVIAR